MNRMPVRSALVAALVVGGASPSAAVSHERGSANGNSAVAPVALAAVRHGTITGFVRDAAGRPLAGALVRLVREGAERVADETRSAGDGTFRLRALPGTYLLQAALAGFDDARFASVNLRATDELIYRFNLQRAGEGRTAAEARPDRDDAKFRVRAASARRSIFNAGERTTGEQVLVAGVAGEAEQAAEDEARGEPVEGVVQTYYAASEDGSSGVRINFAFGRQVNDRTRVVVAGQTGVPGATDAPARLGLQARTRLDERHTLRTRVGFARSGVLATGYDGGSPDSAARTARTVLRQLSAQALDEWIVRDGVVVVLGFDYARFAGGRAAVSPRIGFQFDVDGRTRLRGAYAPGARRDAAGEFGRVEFEDGDVVLGDASAAGEFAAVADGEGKLLVERTRRLEFGVERVLDDRSRIEATAFFDTTDDRGVGLLRSPTDGLRAGDGFAGVAEQEGAARGVRVVYARRLNDRARVSAGYSFGRGQSLAPDAGRAAASGRLAPQELFRDGYFQTCAAQLDAEPLRGTQVQAVVRFSPQATVFAVDPFAGQLAVYDPSLSILVAQELPSFGLPLRLKAIVDARNLLDLGAQSEDADAAVSLNTLRRSVRGGIAVRF